MFPQTYLGLPLSDRKLSASTLEFLATKISIRIPSWRNSLVLIGGSLTLNNVVLSALPTYVMSVLPIPQGFLAKMDRPRRAMVRATAAVCSGGDCRVAWDYVFWLRSKGGIGLVDLALRNKCMLLMVVHGLLARWDTPWTWWVWRCSMGALRKQATPSWRHFESLPPLYRSLTRVEPATVGPSH